MKLTNFPDLPLALQRRLLRSFAEAQGIALDFEHVELLLHCALGELPQAELPGGWTVRRRGDCLYLQSPARKPECLAYRYTLPVPGEVRIPEVDLTVRAMIVRQELAAQVTEPGNLLSMEHLGPELTVRNWHPGDRFWPLQTASEQKLKRLFAEKHIVAEERLRWPVALRGETIVWVRGFPVARTFAWSGTGEAVRIEAV